MFTRDYIEKIQHEVNSEVKKLRRVPKPSEKKDAENKDEKSENKKEESDAETTEESDTE